MASCTPTSQGKIADRSGLILDLSAKQIHTPSTVCPTPRTPVSPQLLPPLAVDFHELTSSSGDVQPFWWSLSEGDEGPLSFPFDEPLTGEEVMELSKATSPKRPGPFGSLGLPDWVYGPRGLRDPIWDDSSDCEDSDGSTQVPSASSSPLDSAFESRAPSPVRPGAGAKVSWADLAEEEEMENFRAVPPAPMARPRVSWADLQEDSEDDLPSWKWN